MARKKKGTTDKPKVEAAKDKPKAEPKPAPPVKAEPKPVVKAIPKPVRYRVAKGKAITCLKGILGEGQPVLPAFLSGGTEEALKNLADQGILEKY